MSFLGANTRGQYLDIKFNPVVSMEQKLLQNILILVISTFSGVSLALLSLWGPLEFPRACSICLCFFIPNESILSKFTLQMTTKHAQQ